MEVSGKQCRNLSHISSGKAMKVPVCGCDSIPFRGANREYSTRFATQFHIAIPFLASLINKHAPTPFHRSNEHACCMSCLDRLKTSREAAENALQQVCASIQGGLFATFCENMGDPLKKESFTARGWIIFPLAKRPLWQVFLAALTVSARVAQRD